MVRSVRQRGFTLLEMAIVITIIGLITSMSITAGIGALEAARYTQTTNKIAFVEQALLSFRNDNHRLPCPAGAAISVTDTSYGKEAANPGSCKNGSPAANFGVAGGVVEGAVPARTLNLPDEYMYDGWGRKFAYAVDSNMTDVNAFDTSLLNDQCGITVKDASGNPRSSGALYTLVSFGPDGHGAFLKDGGRMNAGLTNTDSLTNCHCAADATATSYNATYVEKDPIGTPGTVNSFDDIVDFQERWQMYNYDDQLNYSQSNWYGGPRILAGYKIAGGGSNSTYDYNLQCGRLVKQADLNPVATGTSTGVAFTPNNSYMMVFSNTGCELYPLNYQGLLVGAGVGTSIPNCPAYDPSIKIAMSNNGYLAITDVEAPFLWLWRQSGTGFMLIGAPFPEPDLQPTSISMSNNYLLVTTSDSTTLYGHNTTSYTAIGPQPTGMPTDAYSATIAPNESYIAITEDGNVGGSPAPKISLWRINSLSSFTALPSINIVNDDKPAAITFSPDGSYMVVGGFSQDNIIIYKVDYGDVFTKLSAPTSWTSGTDTAGTGFAFSPDSRYIAMITNSTAHPMALFRQSASNQYRYVTEPDASSKPATTAAASVAFIH